MRCLILCVAGCLLSVLGFLRVTHIVSGEVSVRSKQPRQSWREKLDGNAAWAGVLAAASHPNICQLADAQKYVYAPPVPRDQGGATLSRKDLLRAAMCFCIIGIIVLFV